MSQERRPAAKSSSLLLTIWLVAVGQLIYSSTTIKQMWPRGEAGEEVQLVAPGQQLGRVPLELSQAPALEARPGPILFAEAGKKKKKKEKSEVVVISVQNPPAKGHGMYPVFIPSCGGHGHGYGRRKRRSIGYV